MKRRIQGLQAATAQVDTLEGLFLVSVLQAAYRWHPQKPFFTLRFRILEPTSYAGQNFSGRIYCTQRALWKLNWFLRDFGYDTDLLGREEVEEKALRGLRGAVRISHVRLNGRSYLNLEAFGPEREWEALSAAAVTCAGEGCDDL